MVTLSIIILSFNTKSLLQSCLESIKKHLKNFSYETIVVDNASTDGSVEEVKKRFSKVVLIENKENVGFAKGCNRGAKVAKEEYLLFLNSDTQIRDEGIKNMIQEMDSDKKIGVMGGRLINLDKTTSESYGKFYSVLSIFAMLFGVRKSAMNELSTKSEVDWVSGGFMLMRKDLFKKLNGFDERFFMYVEDVDLCFRVKQMGRSVLYFPQAVALHKGQGSSTRSFAIIYIYQGILLYFRKHKNLFEYLIVKWLLIIKGILAIILGTITGNMYLVSTYKKALRF